VPERQQEFDNSESMFLFALEAPVNTRDLQSSVLTLSVAIRPL
jgi:hypothetical protein